MGIFREKALTKDPSTWLGRVRIASPLSHTAWASSFAALGLAVCCFLYFGEYTRREKVVGQLVSRGGVVRIASTSGGYVSQVRISEGDRVTAGLPVLVVNNESYSIGTLGVKQNISLALRGEQSAIRVEMDALRDNASSTSKGIRRQLALLSVRLKEAEAQLALLQEEERNQQELLEKMTSLLAVGYVSDLQVQQQRSTLALARANVGRQRSEMSGIRMETARLSADLEKVPLDLAGKLSASERLLADTAIQAQSVAAEKNITLLSPVAGAVSSVLVSEGQAVKAGQTLMTIVEESAEIEAQLYVDSRSIGFIRPGSKVALKLRAFPFEKFGVLIGSVRARSLTPLTPEEIAGRLGIAAPSESMFLVRVTLKSQSLDGHGETLKLMPGMYVDADVLLDRRKLYEWMFRPAYSFGGRS